MKIALTGAHGVGKSTLALELTKHYQNIGLKVDYTKEVPRIICGIANDKEFFRRGRNSPLKQSLIFLGQLIEENKKDSFLDLQICDRTLFDHWAYTMSQFSKEFQIDNLSEIFESLISQYCLTYDLIFYIPIEFKVKDDGTREGDIKFQEEIDILIKGLLDLHKINYVVIKGSVSERCEQIISNIDIKKKQ